MHARGEAPATSLASSNALVPQHEVREGSHLAGELLELMVGHGPLRDLRVVAVEHADLLDRLGTVSRSPLIRVHLATKMLGDLHGAGHVPGLREDLIVEDVARDGL